jgi:hypothetical protein
MTTDGKQILLNQSVYLLDCPLLSTQGYPIAAYGAKLAKVVSHDATNIITRTLETLVL